MTKTKAVRYHRHHIYENSPRGFWAWVRYYEPHILDRHRKYIPFQATRQQEHLINIILEAQGDGKKARFKKQLALLVQPRRHAKSTIMMLIVLWLFSTRENFTVQLVGNDEGHSRRVQYNRLKKCIQHSPKIIELIGGTRHITDQHIGREDLKKEKGKAPKPGTVGRAPKLTSVIQCFSGLSTSSAFGDMIQLLWVSDYHATPDTAPFDAWQASLLDSDQTMVLIDSNTDGFGGHVHQLEEAADLDPGMVAYHQEYADLADYIFNAPPWIDRDKAKALQKTTLPDEFKRDILGQRTRAQSFLFSQEIIDSIKTPFTLPVSQAVLKEITQGKEYFIGAGLDRAKTLIKTSTSDSTVWSVVLKVQSPGKEPDFILLNQKAFKVNTDKNVLSTIIEDHERYAMDNVVMENYEVSGLYHRCIERKIPVELVTPTQQLKNISIPEFYRVCSEGRFKAPADHDAFYTEMQGYTHKRNPNGSYVFVHKKYGHDDHIDSISWAIYSTREMNTVLFTLDSVDCSNAGPGKKFCYLLGGDHILNACSMRCAAHHQVLEMHQAYLREQPDSDINLVDFFNALVKVTYSNYRI